MKGNEGGVKINIDVSISTKKTPEPGEKSGGEGCPFRGWIWKVCLCCIEDTNRVTISLKVGLAVLHVSLLILVRAPYEIFGTNIIWSILTVAIMSEYTVGATLNRRFNRALGSFLAGIIAIAVIQVALSSGRAAEPFIIGLSIFLIGALTSLMKMWPSLVPYEYGFRVILSTFCLIVVSGYRMGSPVKTAMDRLYSIAIGAFVAVLVNVLIFPIWAGEQLHAELVKSFDAVADSLEECVKKYMEDDGSRHPEFSTTVTDDFADEPAFRKCRATLNWSAKLESLAQWAKWEPPHGRFRHFFYPWSEYVKVGAVLRHCAYEVMALNGVLHSEIQAPYNLRVTFRSEILDATSQAAELIRTLGKDLNNMKHRLETSLLKRVHSSTVHLQRSIDMHSYLLTSTHDHHLMDKSNKPLPQPSKLSQTFSSTLYELSDLGSTGPEPSLKDLSENKASQVESYHETLKRQQRRLYSWPSREVDEFEEEGAIGTGILLPKMRALESTAALSLATFTSLLIEFVVRLDHLVEAIDELAKLAKFKPEPV